MNKKTLITLSAIALFFTAAAQNKTVETWPNGNKKSEGVIIGTAVDASASKATQAQQAANSTKDGKWNTWFENGALHTEEFYTNGAMTGAWKAWYEDGKVESDINFTTGKAVHFHKNGNKQSEGGIAAGMISTGKWISYHENGNINCEGSYTMDGQKDGTWTWYDEKGKVTATQTFNKGELVK